MDDVIFEIGVDSHIQRCGRPIRGYIRVESPVYPVEIESLVITLEGVGSYSYYVGSTPIRLNELLLQVQQVILQDQLIQEGDVNFLYELNLPEDLPPTYKTCSTLPEKAIEADIYYTLKVTANNYKVSTMQNRTKTIKKTILVRESRRTFFARSMFMTNCKHNMIVLPIIDGNPIENGSIAIIVNFEKPFFAPGENIRLNLQVINETEVAVKTVALELLRHTGIFKANNDHPNVMKIYTDAKARTGSVGGFSKKSFPVELRVHSRHFTISQPKLFEVWFRIMVRPELQAPYTHNDDMSIPMEITEKRIRIPPSRMSNNNDYQNSAGEGPSCSCFAESALASGDTADMDAIENEDRIYTMIWKRSEKSQSNAKFN
ncbi:hypothetical protein O0L34_g11659 [Tuta absoluta]|nr:hypothetical protein O0L34_g11659 [Tuta absoluta]